MGKLLNITDKTTDRTTDRTTNGTTDKINDQTIKSIQSTLNKSSDVWIKKEFRDEYNAILSKSFKLLNNKQKIKITLDMIPIGHYIDKFPKIYNGDMWVEDPTFNESKQKFIENETIIGYDTKSENGIFMRFKLRKPTQNTKEFNDNRLIETGTVCTSKSKSYLIDLVKELNIVIDYKPNVENLCSSIRNKLIRLELIERKKKSNIKYFYFHYEQI